METSQGGARPILLDAHVHIHPGWFPETVFDAAAAGFARAEGALFLTESAGANAFAGLGGRAGRWRVEETGEKVSRRLARDDGARLLLVAGRQVVAAEGIEIHAFGALEAPGDGAPARDVIAAIDVACLPWGVGKWSGERGRLVRALIETGPEDLIFADCGVRPSFWPRPALLRIAAAAGRRVLAGSDPLPVPRGETRAGGYGVTVAVDIDGPAPFAAIMAAVKGAPPVFGRLETPGAFLANQIAMQIAKRRRG